jgi:hypothetical protein
LKIRRRRRKEFAFFAGSPDLPIIRSPDFPIYQTAFQNLLAAVFVPLMAAPGAETMSVRTTPVPFFKAVRVVLPASSTLATAVTLASEVF